LLVSLHTTGRGTKWALDETAHLAEAILRATEDPISGVDQKAVAYAENIHNFFLARDPSEDKTIYEKRKTHAVFRRTKEISMDIMKFRKALTVVRASESTGCNEDNIISMAIAVHLDECDTDGMNYDFKDVLHSTWVCSGAWEVLREHPKWQGVAGPVV
jgi:hypothetical protein